jgi:hypothetical protein
MPFTMRQSTLGNPVQPGEFRRVPVLHAPGEQRFQSEAFCEDAAGTVHCQVEADSGRFTIETEGPNLLLRIERIEVEGPESFSPDLAVGGDDRVVRLFPAPKSSCSPD